jgi:hypothetical protein
MMATRNVAANDNLEAVRKRFEDWRKSRIRVGPIPDELWNAAIHAARSAGVNRTAIDLHLDAGKLKRLVLAADRKTSGSARAPRFVELISPLPAVTPECVIEFESAFGGKLRIHWKSPAAPDWTSLLRAWRDVER